MWFDVDVVVDIDVVVYGVDVEVVVDEDVDFDAVVSDDDVDDDDDYGDDADVDVEVDVVVDDEGHDHGDRDNDNHYDHDRHDDRNHYQGPSAEEGRPSPIGARCIGRPLWFLARPRACCNAAALQLRLRPRTHEHLPRAQIGPRRCLAGGASLASGRVFVVATAALRPRRNGPRGVRRLGPPRLPLPRVWCSRQRGRAAEAADSAADARAAVAYRSLRQKAGPGAAEVGRLGCAQPRRAAPAAWVSQRPWQPVPARPRRARRCARRRGRAKGERSF